MPGEVDSDIIWWVGTIDSPIAIIPGVIASIFYAQYRIDKNQYNETRRKLSEQGGAAAPDTGDDTAATQGANQSPGETDNR